MIRTDKYKLPYFLDGDLFSASVDRQRAIALDLILHGLATLVDDGVISGLECIDLGGLNIKVTEGDAFISGYYSRNFSETFLTLFDNQTNYLYALRDTVDILDGESEPSNIVNISFIDTDPPSAPSNLLSTSDVDSILIEWDQNTENDISYYELEGKLSSELIYQDLVTYTKNEDQEGVFSYRHEGLLPLSSYDYRVRAFDTSSNGSPYSFLTDTTLQDLQPPGEISGLQLFSGDSQITLIWNHSNDLNNDLAYYFVILNELDVSGNIISADEFNVGLDLAYGFTNLKNETNYRITVKSVDESDNVSVGVSSEIRPSTQGGLIDASDISVLSENRGVPNVVTPQITINWTYTDFSSFSNYNIYIIDDTGISEPINAGNSSSKTIFSYPISQSLGGQDIIANKSFKDSTTYTLFITSVSTTGYESSGSYYRFTIPRFTSPSPVSSFSVIPGDGKVNLSWTRADSQFFDHYELFYWKVSDKPLIQEEVEYDTFFDKRFNILGSYNLDYVEGDFVELVERPSSGGPPVPMFFSNSSTNNTVVDVDKIIPGYYDKVIGSSDPVKILLTNVPTPIILPDITTYEIDGLDNDEEYEFALMVVDNTGLRSFAPRFTVTPTEGDLIPDNPTNVLATSDNARINISWNISNFVDGYSVYRAGPLPFGRESARLRQFDLYTIIDDPNQQTMSDFDVEEDLLYSYIVVGRLSGNEGVLDALNQTTSSAFNVDTVEPPENLAATSSNGEIMLSWDNPGDVNIEGWNIYRSNAEFYGYDKIITLPPSVTTFTDSGLQSGFEYYYYVTSFDSTLEVALSLSDNATIDSILLGTIRTANGDIVEFNKESSVISGLQSRIEQYTKEFLSRHLHEENYSDFFNPSRTQSIKINLSNDDVIFNFTTTDYKTYLSPFDLVDGKNYTAYLNGEPTTLFYQIDTELNTISFENVLYSPDGLDAEFETEPLLVVGVSNEKEVTGVLNQNLIGNISAELITSGVLPKSLLPTISHTGRIKEQANVRTFPMFSRDFVTFYFNINTYTDPDYDPSSGENPKLINLKLGQPTVFYALDKVGSVLYGSTNRGLFKSQDNGIVWERYLSTDNTIKFLYTSQSSSSIYYAIGQSKVYLSRNGYETFRNLTGLNAVSIIHDFAEGEDYSLYLATDVGLMILDGNSIDALSFRTASYISNGTITTDFLSVFVNSSNDPVVSNIEGVFTTSDGGKNWTSISDVAPLYKIQRYSDDSLIAIHGNDGFLYRSFDEGVTWERQLSIRNLNAYDLLKVIDNRIYFTRNDGVYYTEDFINLNRIEGEINSTIDRSHAQLIYGDFKNDVIFSFDNKLYKYFDQELFLWTEFLGVSPIIYNNGKVLKQGYYYNSDFNKVDLEFQATTKDNLEISMLFDSYQLPARGWQDIDGDDVTVEMFIDGNRVQGEIEVTNEDGSISVQNVDIIKSTDVSEYSETDEDGNIIEGTRNKVYIFNYEQFQIHVNSKNGTVVFFNPPNSDETGDVTSTSTLLNSNVPNLQNSLTKFNNIQVSVNNVSLINEGEFTHTEIEDTLSEQDMGFDFDLGNTYIDAMLQMGLSVEHNYLENAPGSYPYPFTNGVKSFNSELINSDFFIFGRKQYDVFNSTVDYVELAVNDEFIEGAFRVNDFVEIFDRTWALTDSNIFALDSTRNFVEKEIFIEPNKYLNVTGFASFGESVFIVASNEIYRSDNKGDSWIKLGGFGLPREVYNIIIVQNIVSVGTSDGIYYANISTDEWVKAVFRDFDSNIVPITGDVRYVLRSSLAYCVINNVLYRSNNGVSWLPITDFNNVSILDNSGITLTVSGLFGYKNLIFVATDQGLYQDNNSLNTLAPEAVYTLVPIDPLDSVIPIKDVSSYGDTINVAADKNSVYRSLDSGNSWNKTIVDEVAVIDLVHIWEGIVITEETQGQLLLRSVPQSVIDKLDPILNDIYADEESLDLDVKSLLTDTEYGNFGNIILQEARRTTEQTELASFLNNIYERDQFGEFNFLADVGSSAILFDNIIEQPIPYSGLIDKVSVYIRPVNYNNSNFTVKLSIYGGDSEGDIITSELDFDIKNSNEILSDSWYNFRLSTISSYDTVVLRMEQVSGDQDETVKWQYCLGDEHLNAFIDGVEQQFSMAYRIYKYEEAVNPIDQLLLSKSAKYTSVTPDLGNGFFDKTKEEDGNIVLDADDIILSFIIDQSGSMSWNDHGRSRIDLVKDFASDLNILYPGDIKYLITTYNGKILSDLIIERVDGDDDRFGKFFRVVRNTSFYPQDPFDGEIVSETSLNVASDDAVIPDTLYYYSVFNIRNSGVYSGPISTFIASNNKLIPLSMGKVEFSTEILQELVAVRNAGDESSSSSSDSSELAEFMSSSSSSLNSSSSSDSSLSSLSSDSSVSESLSSDSSLSDLNSSSSSEITFEYRDTGKRLVRFVYQPIVNYQDFYNEVRIVRKRVDSDDIEKVANITDGDVLYEGTFVEGINEFVDDFGGTEEFPNGVTFVYAFFTKNEILGSSSSFPYNYCLPENAQQQIVKIPPVPRPWLTDEEIGATPGFEDIPLDPVGFTVEAGDRQNKLSWQAPGSDEVGYVIYCSNTQSPAVDRDSFSTSDSQNTPNEVDEDDNIILEKIYEGQDLSFVHRDLTVGKLYYYRVFSYNQLRTLSVGDSVGQGIVQLGGEDVFEAPEPFDFNAEIINNENILLKWKSVLSTLTDVLYYNDIYYLRSAGFDKFGSPISKIEDFDFNIDETSTELMESTEAGNHLRPRGSDTVVDSYYAFAVDKRTFDSEIRSQLEVVANVATLNNYKNFKFLISSKYSIIDPETEKLSFQLNSEQFECQFSHPLKVGVNNVFSSKNTVLRTTRKKHPLKGCKKADQRVNGLYIRTGESYFGYVALTYEGLPIPENDFGNLTVSIDVFDMTGRSFAPRSCREQRFFSDTRSETIIAVDYQLTDFVNRKVAENALNYVSGNINAVDLQDLSEVVDGVDATVVEFELLPSDLPREVMVVATVSYLGYVYRAESFVKYHSVLNIDLTARAPLGDGSDIPEQFVTVYLGPPNKDANSDIPRKSIRDNIPIKWELIPLDFGRDDRPFFSTDIVDREDGIYSLTRDGVAGKVFFGPADNVKKNTCETDDGTPYVCGEIYLIKATVIVDGLTTSAEAEVEIKPFNNEGAYRFYMTNGKDMEGDVIWADGSDETVFEIFADPDNPSSGAGQGGEEFVDCLSNLGYQYIVLYEGQQITINGDRPLTILEQLSGVSLEDLQDESENRDDSVYETWTYKGVDYSSPNDIPLFIENGYAQIIYKVNRYVGPQPCDESGSANPGFNDCYGEIRDTSEYPPKIFFEGRASSILDGNSIRMIGGGDVRDGLPPVFVRMLEPLDIQFVTLAVNGESVALPPNNGIDQTEVVFDVTFAGEPVPEGVIVNFELIFQGKKRCDDTASSSSNPFEDIDSLPLEERRAALGGFSSSRELIESVKLVSNSTTTRIVDGKSVVSAFIDTTLITFDLQFLLRAKTTYDKLGQIERLMEAETEIVFLGSDEGVYTDTVERFDPNTGQWIFIDSMNLARGGHFAHYNPANGKIYAGAGNTRFGIRGSVEEFTYWRSDKEPIEDELSSSSVELESVSSSDQEIGLSYGQWVDKKANLSRPRAYMQSVIYNGGFVGFDSSSSSNNESSSSSLTSENSSLSSFSSDSSSENKSENRIYVIGGYGFNNTNSNTSEETLPFVDYYDIDNDEFVSVSDMPESISHGASELVGDNIFVFSGLLNVKSSNFEDEDYNFKIFRYNIINDEWSLALDLTRFDEREALRRISPSSYVVGDKIYVFGGNIGGYDLSEDSPVSTLNEFNSTMFEIDVSDPYNITLTEVSFSETVVNRFRFGGSYLNDNFYAFGGSGNKEYSLSSTTESYDSYTLSALEIFDNSLQTWETYSNNNGLEIPRYNHVGLNDGEFIYAISGAGPGYPSDKLFITITLGPEEMLADGIQTVSVNTEVRKITGEPPEDDINIIIRGFVILPFDLFSGAQTVEDSSNLRGNVPSIDSISDIVDSEQEAVERLNNRISIYPVKFSNNEGLLKDGSMNVVLFERGEDPLTDLSDLIQFSQGDDQIIGLVFDGDQIVMPDETPTIVNKGERRDLYSIIVEGTIDHPVYFGQTDTASAVASLTDQDSPTSSVETDLVNSEFTPQDPSPILPVYSDIMWVPNSTVFDSILDYDGFIEKINIIEQDPPFGGSAHWDAISDNSQGVIKDDSIVDISKLIIDVSDTEENLSSITVQDSLDAINGIDGFMKTPIFMNAFVVDFPPSLSARAGASSSVDFEFLSGQTNGLSHTLLDESFVQPVSDRMKTGSIGSVGRGTYIQIVDLGEEVLVTDVENSFDIFQYTDGGIYLEYSSDGYNYDIIDRVLSPNSFESFNFRARFIRFTVFLQTTYGDASTVSPSPSPAFTSITIGYSNPTRQYLYTYPVDTNYPVREIFLTSNSNMIPQTSSVKLGISHSDSTDWFDYASEYQSAVEESGRIVVVNHALRTLELRGSENIEGGNTIDSPKTYDQITSEFIQRQEEIYNEKIVKIIVVEENTSTDSGQTLLIFENDSQQLVDEAPDYSGASDLSDLTGQNPTFNVTKGTVFNYDFMKTNNGYDFFSTYGPWQPGALVNVYINDVIVNTSEYLAFSNLGLIRFNTVRNQNDSVSLEVILPPRFRIGIEIINRDYRSSVIMHEFAYMFSQDILSGISRGNVPPVATNLIVTTDTQDASIYSVFTANYNYYDVNNQPERNSIINWYINDNLVSEIDNKISWNSSDLVGKRLQDGDRIYFTVQPSDGELIGVITISAKVVLGVTPPSVENLRFAYIRGLVTVPEASASTDVIVNYNYVDPLSRPESGSTVQWFLNNSPIDVGGDYVLQIVPGQTAVVQSVEGAGEEVVILQRGNTISATVTPSNGIVSGAPISTDTIVVQNSSPSIQNLVISPTDPSVASVLSFTYAFIDADNDDDNSTYEWYRNGEVVDSLANARTVSSSFLNRGDSWYVIVTPFDGQDEGFTVQSSTVTIR